MSLTRPYAGSSSAAPTSARNSAEAARLESSREMLSMARDAPAPVGERLRNRVVEQHLDVVHAIAKRYAGPRGDGRDLFQVGCVGLINAANRFDPERGTDFVAFAAPTVAGEMKRYLRDHGWVVRPPRRLQEVRSAAVAASAAAQDARGERLDAARLAERIGCTREELDEALRLNDDLQVLSLDVLVPSENGAGFGDGLGAGLGADDPRLALAEMFADVRPALERLSARDQLVLRLRFVDELSQQEIGSVIGVTQMQVSRILRRVLAQLRAQVGAGADGESDYAGREVAEPVRITPRPAATTSVA